MVTLPSFLPLQELSPQSHLCPVRILLTYHIPLPHLLFSDHNPYIRSLTVVHVYVCVWVYVYIFLIYV